MTEASDLAKYASKANAVFNSVTANSTAITSMSVGGASINATSFAGTANNATNLGGVAAASYQLNSTLAANVATLAANSSSYANASVTNTFTVGTSAYFVSNGNVGIGTSSPTYELTVNGGTLGTTLNGTVNAFQVYALSNNADYLNFYKIRQTAANSSWETAAWRIQQVVDTTSQGYIQFNGSSATDTISFGTGNTERMRIAASGNVGIGTSSPSYKLDVYSTSGDNIIASRSGASGAGIFLAVGSNTTFAAYNALISTESSGTQQWYLGGDGVANTIIMKTGTTERMRIDSSGNVGIGNTAPAHKLRVQGDISVSGGIHANGSLGTAGQTLTSNGTVAYWATAAGSGTVTSVATGSGLTGGTITTTGTLSVLANTGIVANVTGLYVNSAYIATLAANSATSPVFTGDAVNRANITTRVDSGFYEHDSGTTAEGWPVNDSGWQHMISCTHSNDANYYAMQIAATFGGQNWYFRNTNNGGTQAWSTMLHSGNFTSYSPGLTGTGASGNWGINITGNAATVTNGLYTTGGQTIANRTRFGPYAGSTQQGAGSNITGIEIFNNGGSGDSNAAAISFHCQSAYGMHMHLRPDAFFGIGGWSASPWRWYVNMGNGDMVAAGNVTAYSDPRLKEDIQKIESPVNKLKKLNGVRFRWKDNSILGHPGEYDYGVLANEVQEVFPEIVADTAHESTDGDKYKAVAYDKLVPVLIEAVKTQQNEIDELKSLVKALMENR